MEQYSYEEVLDRMNHASVFGSLPGVEISRQILEALGHPEQGIPFVHVAGTNGKGSVCTFLSSILQESGLKVGTFTSPHLIHFEERITVNGVQIARDDVKRLGNQLLSLNLLVSPTMFDYCMAMALLYFKEQKCDILVMETGLGGRLDSTNAIGVPEVTIITKIGYDHVAILGDTLSQIASEKAGIIKAGTYFVTEQQEKEAADVIAHAARRVGNVTYNMVTNEDINWVRSRKLGLVGTHQWENAATAAVAAKHLLGKNKPWNKKTWNKEEIDEQITRGLEKAYWPGRMEQLSKSPFFMVDGAHNSNGVEALYASLCYMYPGEKFHFIMGVMADKDYEKMVEQLLPLASRFSTVTPESTRALQAKTLAEVIGRFGIETDTYGSVQDIVKEILQDTVSSEKIVAFGSLYFIGELKAIWEQLKKR